MITFIQFLITGLRLGSVYALIALGYTMVYGIIKLINFAHGDFIMVGGYSLFFTIPLMMAAGIPGWLAVVPAIVICACVGMLVELLAYRPVRKTGNNLTCLITAIAMSFVLENLAQAIPAIGPDPKVPYTLFAKTFTIGGVSVSHATIITVAVSAAIMVALYLSTQKAKVGCAMRCVSEDKEAATLMGINVNHTILVTFGIGAGLAAVAALMYIAQYPKVYTTLGFGMIIVNLINNLPFCGQQGLSQGSASSSLYATGLGFSNDEKMQYLWVAALAIIICMTCMFMFVRSKYGRCIRAIRDNEIAASASGINVSYYKMLTFTISAFFAGITGALYACSNAALSTTSFAFTNGSILNSVFIVVMVVVGGMGSLTGSVIAAVVLFLLNYTIKNGAWVSALPAFLQNVFTYPMLVYSIALIIVIMFQPRGIMGSKEFALCDIPRWPARLRTWSAARSAGKSVQKEAGHHV